MFNLTVAFNSSRYSLSSSSWSIRKNGFYSLFRLVSFLFWFAQSLQNSSIMFFLLNWCQKLTLHSFLCTLMSYAYFPCRLCNEILLILVRCHAHMFYTFDGELFWCSFCRNVIWSTLHLLWILILIVFDFYQIVFTKFNSVVPDERNLGYVLELL